MDSTILYKVLSLVIIWLLAIVGGLLPIGVKSYSTILTGILSMFAAGIFLASSFVHLLPDAVNNESLKEWGCSSTEEPCKDGYPVANLFFGIGFLSILILEVCAHIIHRKFGDYQDYYHPNHNEQSHLLINSTKGASPSSMENGDLRDRSVSHAHIDGLLDHKLVVSIVVFVSLSFHSIMEGIGIGSQPKPAWDIFIAIIAHKGLAAFSLGLELCKHNVSKIRLISSIFFFSLMTPIGIVFSWYVTSSSNSEAASGVCTALAAGTFLYVAVMEIIPQELQERKHQIAKCIALCLGYSCFSLLAKWT